MRHIIVLAVLVLLITGHAAADERQSERDRMVRMQLENREIECEATLEAMRTVPRHLFMPLNVRHLAYADRPAPIGHGQTISQPYIVAMMTEVVSPQADHKVLEIGTGSGYQAAVLSEIVDQVYTIEIIPELADWSIGVIEYLDYKNIEVKTGDGYYGWEEHAPFDAIVVTAAAEHIPPPLIEQLKDGGKMIIPVGSPFMTQNLMLVEKTDGEITTSSLMPVRFVPFTRHDD